jgi:dCMP deaminase
MENKDIERISRDELFMRVAKLFALRATCKRGQVGAIIVRDYRIISSGYNGSINGDTHCTSDDCDLSNPCTKAVHSEMNAILYAARVGIDLAGTTIYCTTAPCLNCAKAIIQAGIVEVIYESGYRDLKGIELLEKHCSKVTQYKEL